MSRVFADTSWFIGLINRNDSHHARARDLEQSHGSDVFTTFWVLAEVANAFSASRRRVEIGTILAGMLDSGTTGVAPLARSDFDEGLLLYRSRHDKLWSLIDCISFVVMRREGISGALTADRHFAQAGFVALMA